MVLNEKKVANWIEYLFWLLLLFICSKIIYLVPSFDAAMNLLPAKNLALHGKYYSFYHQTYFYHAIQTRFFHQIPASFLIYLFGLKSWAFLLPNVLYLGGIFYFLKKLNDKLCHQNFYNFLLFPFLFICPKLFYVALKGWGEPIAFFFVILASYIFVANFDKKSNKTYLLIGILFGCSIVTKTIMLIILIALAISFSILLYQKKIGSKAIVYTVIGITIPIISYEFFKLFTIGYDAYISWWKHQSKAISYQMGFAEKNTSKIVEIVKEKIAENKDFIPKKTEKLNNFSKTATLFNCHPLILVLFIVNYISLIGYFFYKKLKSFETSKQFVFIFFNLIILSYFLWWFLLSPTEKLTPNKIRRILPALLLIFFNLSFVLTFYLKNYKKVLHKITFIASIVFTVIFCLLNFESTKSILLLNYKPDRFLTEVDQINTLPEDSKIYSIGYFQLPKHALYANKHFYDISKIDLKNLLTEDNSYIIFDNTTFKKKLRFFNDVFDYDVVYDYLGPPFLKIIKLKGLKTDLPYHKGKLKKKLEDIKEVNSYRYKYGYIFESRLLKIKRPSSVVSFVLKGGIKYKTLKFNYELDPNVKVLRRDELKISVYVNGNFVSDVPLSNSLNEFSLYLNKKILKRSHNVITIYGNQCNEYFCKFGNINTISLNY